jgi:hypothetical protein
MNDRGRVSASLAVALVNITMKHVNAMLAAGCVDIDVDAVHTHTIRQYREALSAIEKSGRAAAPPTTPAGHERPLGPDPVTLSWAWKEACAMLDRGEDPRKVHVDAVWLQCRDELGVAPAAR